MRFFVMRVVLDEDGARSCGIDDTAFVSCWINDSDREAAWERARALIEAQGWRVAETIEDYSIAREDYDGQDEGLQYYEQALTDGEVAVFFVVRPGSASGSGGESLPHP